MLDWNNPKLVASGINFTYTVEEDGFYLISVLGYSARIYVYVNGILVALGGNAGNFPEGWQGDHNFLLLSKGDVITTYKPDSSNRCGANIYYIPFRR